MRHTTGKLVWGLSVLATMALLAGITGAAEAAKIVVEAEHYYQITPSMAYAQSQVASGGYYIQIPLRRPHGENQSGPSDNGNALYCIYLPNAGRWTLWGRCHWHDGCGNSFFVYMDRETTPSILGEDGTYQAWHWVKGKTFELSAGWHWLRIQNREDGSKIDQFVFTDNKRYVPVNAEKETPQYNRPAQ